MKLNFWKPVFACALAVGLMSFTTSQARAGTVIGGQLYAPVSLKVVFTYYDSNGKFKNLTVSTKDILLLLGYDKNNQLARGPGGDIYVITKDTVMSDLTAAGYLSMNFQQLLYTETHPNDGAAFSFMESGLLTVNFYSDGRVEDFSGHNSDVWFEVGGAYTGSGNVSAPKNNQQTVSEKLKSPVLSGSGFDIDVSGANENNPSPLPVTGSASGSGSGKVQVVD